MGIPLGQKITKDTDRGREGDIFVPDDKYYVRVLKMEEREKKGTEGETFIAGEYEILDAASEDGAVAIGLRIFDIFSTSEAAMWKPAKFLDCCYAPEKFEGSEIPDDIEGKELVVRIKNEKFKDNVNARVKAYFDRFNWDGHTTKTNSEGEQVIEGKSKADGKAQVSV